MISRRKKRKIRYGRIFICLLLLIGIIALIIYLFPKEKSKEIIAQKEVKMIDITNKSIDEIEIFINKNNLKLETEEEYSYDVEEGKIISQSIKEGTKLEKGDTIKVIVSKGEIPTSIYSENKVNELGSVPIMMYHGIHDISSNSTGHTGGNVDKDGYNRTAEAFRGDLEFYYQNNYRMIRLTDYIDGNIDVALGKSPIILTFDDGKENNMKVLGEKNGELEIDPNCAVGVLEEFKKKYPDYNVTATFFINGGIFDQEEYNEKILKWLVSHGYDVGNHTMTHPDFTKISTEKAKEEVGGLYKILESIIPGKYVNIIAMPFGSPYSMSHPNFQVMLKGTYEGKEYSTKSMLRVGWEGEVSPFDKDFEPTFLKRIRAYDNNGVEFDIQMNFNILKNTKYISDGDKDTIVVPEKEKNRLKTNKRIRTY